MARTASQHAVIATTHMMMMEKLRAEGEGKGQGGEGEGPGWEKRP